MNRKERLMSMVLCVCLIAGMMAGCGQSDETVDASAEVRAAISVQTQTPTTGSLALSTQFVGRVEPGESVYVFPKAAGEVMATYFNVGDRVNQGDVLFAIDDSYIQLQVEAAQAQYEATEAQIQQQLGSTMDLNILQAKSAYEQAKNAFRQVRDAYDDTEDSIDDNKDALKAASSLAYDAWQAAQSDLETVLADPTSSDREKAAAQTLADTAHKEYNSLYSQYKELKSSEDSTLDSLETNKDNAKLGMDTASESFDITTGKLQEEARASAAAQLNAVAVSIKSAAKQLQDTRVTSPISGVVELKNVDPHDMASSGNYAYVVSNKDSMTVTFNVSSTAIAAMEVGDPVTVTSGSKDYEGAITEVSTMVDQQSGLFKVKASIVDAQDLYTGMTVTLIADTQKSENAMVIPLTAVYYEEGKPYVYVNENNVAVKTFIETGIDDNEYIEVLSGLTPTTLVITSWDTNLIDGALLSGGSTSTDAPASGEASAVLDGDASEEEEPTDSEEAAQSAESQSAAN